MVRYNAGTEKPINYLEFDGSTKQTDRQLIVDAFNGAATEDSKNPFFSENRYDTMLISTLVRLFMYSNMYRREVKVSIFWERIESFLWM